jgi:putative ATP-binding cassette transporter
LKEALCYPSEESAFDDAACREALSACELPGYEDRLGERADWSHRLSPGEQQRVALARALLQNPDYLFLDEATSALEQDTARKICKMLDHRLPKAALISVTHGEEPGTWSAQILEVTTAGIEGKGENQEGWGPAAAVESVSEIM